MSLTRLLQLASPALPIGGYSYSTALEWGIECGRVKDESTALQWIDDSLMLTLATFEGPVMVAALRLAPAASAADVDPGARSGESRLDAQRSMAALNEIALAARETAELRLESEQMGYSLGKWIDNLWPAQPIDPALRDRLTPLSLPVAWAIAASRLGLPARDALLGLLWTFVENQAMVLMKALPMGQVAAQRLLLALGPRVESAADRALALDPTLWSSAAPALAVASMHHETQYSRLFRS